MTENTTTALAATTPPDVHGDLPQFASVMRGYDRGQVDDYVSRLIDFLSDAESRADRAEATVTELSRRVERLTAELRTANERRNEPTPEQPFQGLGERIEAMLRLAAEEADDIRRQGHADADEMMADARRRRHDEVSQAERELATVAARRDGVVSELSRVRDVLATLGLRPAVAAELAGDDNGQAPNTAEPSAPAIDLRRVTESTDDADPDRTQVVSLPSAGSSGG
jgi:DivIVA domain-containing protein